MFNAIRKLLAPVGQGVKNIVNFLDRNPIKSAGSAFAIYQFTRAWHGDVYVQRETISELHKEILQADKELQQAVISEGYEVALLADETNIEAKKIYLKIQDGSLAFVLKDSMGQQRNGKITVAELPALADVIQSPLNLRTIQPFLPSILSIITSKINTNLVECDIKLLESRIKAARADLIEIEGCLRRNWFDRNFIGCIGFKVGTATDNLLTYSLALRQSIKNGRLPREEYEKFKDYNECPEKIDESYVAPALSAIKSKVNARSRP